jgi:hypothetical protein
MFRVLRLQPDEERRRMTASIIWIKQALCHKRNFDLICNSQESFFYFIAWLITKLLVQQFLCEQHRSCEGSRCRQDENSTVLA